MEENKNLAIYDAVREVPDNAKKPISAGRLRGKTDINPMWRIKVLTEQFGICGIGWKYEILKMWTESGTPNEVSAFVHIHLFVKVNGEWSDAIPGIGGSSFVTREKTGNYQSDECYKMALTDAISVACKALGIGADVYWEADKTKYTSEAESQQPVQQPKQPVKKIFPKEKYNDEKVLKWLYDISVKKRQEKKPFSVAAVLEANYIVQPEDIQIISENLTNYMVKNNLQ